eukprot:5973842-Karenia_brevis.AAC.1
MSYSRFVAVSRSLLTMAPLRLSQDEAKKCSSYDLRRGLPSVAGLLRLEAHERASLDNWRDVSDSKSSHIARAASASRYDATRVSLSASVK